MKKILLPIVFILSMFNIANAEWTMEMAEHLAKKALYGADKEKVQELYEAWSATWAVDILFPSQEWPDRTEYNIKLEGLLSWDWLEDTSNWNMREYYLYKKLYDPYEAKSKLFSVFEDTFSVDTRRNRINYGDIEETHDMLYSHTLWNYKEMVKRNLYNNWKAWDYSLWEYLDLFNQKNPSYPNENYAREILQLFLMLEYIPTESEDTWAERNYTEQDVLALAKILFWFKADEETHEVTYDADSNTNMQVDFLEWSLKTWDNFPFLSWDTLYIQDMKESIDWNNWLPDNTVDYIFSKREYAIAMFLADKFYRFYVANDPTKEELDIIADKIIENDFEIYPSIKWLLSSNFMYSQKSLNSIIYKNPLELAIWTIKKLELENVASNLDLRFILDRLNFTPYNPWSIFWRDGYDDNRVFFTPYIANKWTSSSSRLASSLIDYNIDYVYDNILFESIKTDNTRYEDNKILINNNSSITWNIVFSGISLFDNDEWNISYNSWSLNWDHIYINSWTYIDIDNWIIDFDEDKFYISSWVLFASNTEYSINSWSASFIIDDSSIQAEDIINILEEKLYLSRTLWEDTKLELIDFLTTDKDGNKIEIDFEDEDFIEINLRGVIYMMLNQPEYVLQSWYNKQKQTNNDNWQLFKNDNKVVFIKAPGWLDFLHAIIQKEEYDEYLDLRWSWAMVWTWIQDLDENYYINANLTGFKELYDNWNLRLINRVWTPDHSRGHDSASRKMTSLHNKYGEDDGIFWYFIQNENPWNTIVLDGWRKPYIFRGWNYMWIWRSATYDIDTWKSWIDEESRDYMIEKLKDIQKNRTYTWDYWVVFQQSAKIDSVSKTSKENGWRSWVWYNMDDKFTFLSSLYDEWLANASWLRADGGYDTHRNQKDYLNGNFRKFSSAITKFFDNVKDEHNVTIVLYSEFWRTNKLNSSNGVDHWHAGWMFIISNNDKLLNEELPNKAYWNMSIKDSEKNWLGVWIDYRSVYSALFKALYNKDISNELWWKFDINDYIDNENSKISLFNKTFSYKYNSRWETNLSFKVDDKNFHNSQASYIRFAYGQEEDNLREVSWWRLKNYYTISDNEYNISFDTNYKKKYYYTLTIYDNQFNKKELSWSFITPNLKKGNNENEIDIDTPSVFKKHKNKQITWTWLDLDVEDIVLSNSWTVLFSWDNDIKLEAFSWTYIQKLTSNDNKTWNGWFILPKLINHNHFIPSTAKYNWKELSYYKKWKLIKVWADTLWVWMKLNKKVNIKLPKDDNKNYTVITSQDGETWELLWQPKEEWNNLIIETDHFSYFLLIELDEDGNPIINIPEDNNEEGDTKEDNTIENTDKNQYKSSWWWTRLVKDNCPYGDFSESYYDKTCWFDPYYEWAMDNITANADNMLSKLRWDLLEYSSEDDDKYNDLAHNLLDKQGFDDTSIKVLSTLIKTKYIWIYKLVYIDDPKYKTYNKAFEKLADFVLSKEYKTLWFKSRFLDELSSFVIYFTIYKEDPKLRKWLKPILISKAVELDTMYKENVIKSSKQKNIKEDKKIEENNNKQPEQIDKNMEENLDKETKKQVNESIEWKLYEVATYSIKLKADPYWERTNAYLYKWDILERLTKPHPKWFFKVKIIESKDGYEWKEWYIFRKYLKEK